MFLSPSYWSVYYRRLVATCFIDDLLQQVVVLSMVNFFMSFHVGNSDGKIKSCSSVYCKSGTLSILGTFGL